MGLNSRKRQRNFHTKKKIIIQNINVPGEIIKPFVKLKGVWFSKEQNEIIVSMLGLMSTVGVIVGIIIGLVIGFFL